MTQLNGKKIRLKIVHYGSLVLAKCKNAVPSLYAGLHPKQGHFQSVPWGIHPSAQFLALMFTTSITCPTASKLTALFMCVYLFWRRDCWNSSYAVPVRIWYWSTAFLCWQALKSEYQTASKLKAGFGCPYTKSQFLWNTSKHFK